MPERPLNLTSPILVEEIISTGKKVSSIETKIDTFLTDQAALKKDVRAIREDVDDLKSKRKTDRAFLAGIIAVVSPAAAFGVAWAKQYFGL